MSLTRFEVRLMVGRTLTRVLDARDDQAADDIAVYLFNTFGDRMFASDAEEIFHCDVSRADAEAAS